jgi:hypothetical protein
MNILTLNLLLSTLVFWIAAKIYVLPKLDQLEPLLHSFRHLGLMFLAPGPITPAFHRSFPIRQPSAICSPPRWRSLRFQP